MKTMLHFKFLVIFSGVLNSFCNLEFSEAYNINEISKLVGNGINRSHHADNHSNRLYIKNGRSGPGDTGDRFNRQSNTGDRSYTQSNTGDRSYRQIDTKEPDYNNDWTLHRDIVLQRTINLLSNASSVEDILGLGLRNTHGQPITAYDLGATYEPSKDKLVINGGGQAAVPDVCTPRKVSIVVNVTSIEANVFLFPKCIQIEKCGGCCSVANVVCEPKELKNVTYNLLKLRVTVGEQIARVEGVYPLEMEQHHSCQCKCVLSEASCGPRKIFHPRLCSCSCNEESIRQRCSPPKYFDPETCTCVCTERLECCTPGEKNCGLSFDERSCSCDIRQMVISSFSNISAYQTNHQQRNLNRHSSLDESSRNNEDAQLYRTTHVPVTTTTLTNVADPCRGLICPSQFLKRVYEDGTCECTPKINRKPRH